MTAPAPEFSRRAAVDQLGPGETAFEISAEPAEREALARRFGILGIDRLDASLRLRPLGAGRVRLSGTLNAEVRQACVVTLEEVPARIDEAVERSYAPVAGALEQDVTLEFDAEEAPDAIVEGAIDLGEAVAEALALALDPYPRAPGVEFAPPPGPPEPERPNPFAVLEKLKKKP